MMGASDRLRARTGQSRYIGRGESVNRQVGTRYGKRGRQRQTTSTDIHYVERINERASTTRERWSTPDTPTAPRSTWGSALFGCLGLRNRLLGALVIDGGRVLDERLRAVLR